MIRLTPSIVQYSLHRGIFLQHKIISSIEKPRLDEWTYATYLPLSTKYNRDMLRYIHILDIRNLQYPFRYLPTPSSKPLQFEYLSEKWHEEIHAELDLLKRHFMIQLDIDGYRVSNQYYLFGNNDLINK
jgi:hypothetical protein